MVCTNRGMSRLLSSSSLTTAPPPPDIICCCLSSVNRLMSTGRSSGSMSDSSTVDGLLRELALVAGRPASASQLQFATSTPVTVADDWTPVTSNKRLRRRRVKATTSRMTTATVMTTAQPTSTVETILS